MNASSPTISKPAGKRSEARLCGFALGSVIAALMLTQFLEALDQTVVSTALPRIVTTLQGLERYSWVVTAYLLASTAVVPLVGKLSDQFGRKGFFIIGVVIFLLGSALAGGAQTMNQLITFRALQGLGSGIGIALVFTVIGDIFPPAERVWWQGIFGAVYGISNAFGPTIGGWLSDHGPLLGSFIVDPTRWRWAFFINLPIGLLALLALVLFLPGDLQQKRAHDALQKIDFIGALLVSAATICLLLGITWWNEQHYSLHALPALALIAISVVLFAAFLLAERVASEPILPLGLFRNQVFAADSALTFLSGMVALSLSLYLPLFLQGVLGISATGAGALMTPFTFSIVFGAAISGITLAKSGRYQAITLVGASLLCASVFLVSRLSISSPLLIAVLTMAGSGIGVGMFYSVQTVVAQNAVPQSQIGTSTSTITFLRSIGQIIGAALLGSIVNNSISTNVLTHLTFVQRQALAEGFSHAFLVALLLCFCILISAFYMKNVPLSKEFVAEPEIDK